MAEDVAVISYIRDLHRHLRAEFGYSARMRISGSCHDETGRSLAGYVTAGRGWIVLASGTAQEMADSLIHEVAHVLSGTRGDEHGRPWSDCLSKVYKCWEAWNAER